MGQRLSGSRTDRLAACLRLTPGVPASYKRRHRMDTPWAIVCDFDGTATTEDIGDRVSIHYGGRHVWREAVERYQAPGGTRRGRARPFSAVSQC